MTTNRFALILFIAMVVFILFVNDAIINMVWISGAHRERCRKDCDNGTCFANVEVAEIGFQRQRTIDIDVTQSIVACEVLGDSCAADVIRGAGANHLPRYPPASAQEVYDAGEYKTHNRIVLTVGVANGQVVIGRSTREADTGPTKFGGVGLHGVVFAKMSTSRDPPPPEAHCLVAAIARPFTLVNFGRRVHIGSEIEVDVKATGLNEGVATVRVRHSRFPTTFIWITDPTNENNNRHFVHQRAEPLDDVLGVCSTFL